MKQAHLEFICTQLQLGSPEGAVISVRGSRGGSFMWRVNTDNGSYAIKQLSPEIDLHSERIITKYELSEKIAYRFNQHGIQAVSAIEKSGKRLIIIENTGYLVYPWVEGYTLGRNEVSEAYALKIAEVIARLHSINMSVPEAEAPRFDVHTNDSILEAINKAVSFKCAFAKNLKENLSLILNMNDTYLATIPLLKEHTVITHGDIDPLNVIWDKADQPILIDWESARRLNPTREIVRASLGWSGMGTEDASLPIYTHMLQAYIKSGGTINTDLVNAALHAVFGSQINWMLYNIRIVCISDISEEVRDSATKEINGVLMGMMSLNILIPDLLKIKI